MEALKAKIMEQIAKKKQKEKKPLIIEVTSKEKHNIGSKRKHRE